MTLSTSKLLAEGKVLLERRHILDVVKLAKIAAPKKVKAELAAAKRADAMYAEKAFEAEYHPDAKRRKSSHLLAAKRALLLQLKRAATWHKRRAGKR
jgi:hypothetical protein